MFISLKSYEKYNFCFCFILQKIISNAQKIFVDQNLSTSQTWNIHCSILDKKLCLCPSFSF